MYSVSEKLLAENHGGHRYWNFAKKEFYKVEHVKLFLGKTQKDFWGRILQQEKRHFTFFGRFIFNTFF